MNTALVDAEHASHAALIECERLLEESLDIGYHSLRRIHEEKLYRYDGYSSFKEYCEQRWGWSKTHAHRLIDYSKVVERLKADGMDHIPSEGQIRPIMKLRRVSKDEDDFLQKASGAVQMVVDKAPQYASVPRVTAQHTESVLSHFGISGRKSKPKEAPCVTELKTLLMKLAHCEAFQSGDGYDFVKKHGDKAFPNDFFDLVQWLQECAEVIGNEQK